MKKPKIEKTTNKERREAEYDRVRWIERTPTIFVKGVGYLTAAEIRARSKTKGRTDQGSTRKKTEAAKKRKQKQSRKAWKKHRQAETKARVNAALAREGLG